MAHERCNEGGLGTGDAGGSGPLLVPGKLIGSEKRPAVYSFHTRSSPARFPKASSTGQPTTRAIRTSSVMALTCSSRGKMRRRCAVRLRVCRAQKGLCVRLLLIVDCLRPLALHSPIYKGASPMAMASRPGLLYSQRHTQTYRDSTIHTDAPVLLRSHPTQIPHRFRAQIPGTTSVSVPSYCMHNAAYCCCRHLAAVLAQGAVSRKHI
jgi:hypothetical protein